MIEEYITGLRISQNTLLGYGYRRIHLGYGYRRIHYWVTDIAEHITGLRMSKNPLLGYGYRRIHYLVKDIEEYITGLRISKEAVDWRKFPGHFKRHFGLQITSESFKQVHTWQKKPECATKSEFSHI